MTDAISNTSPLLYLYRIDALECLPQLFNELWTPDAVAIELQEGRRRGYDVPNLKNCAWLEIVEPRSVPSEWLALDLGPGELAAMALALENPDRAVLLDDALARRVAQAAGLEVWGTLKCYSKQTHKGSLRTCKYSLIGCRALVCGFLLIFDSECWRLLIS